MVTDGSFPAQSSGLETRGEGVASSSSAPSSDGGQAHNPMPADGDRQFVHVLHAEGIAAADFRVMCRDDGELLVSG